LRKAEAFFKKYLDPTHQNLILYLQGRRDTYPLWETPVPLILAFLAVVGWYPDFTDMNEYPNYRFYS